jgi:hypothetical protein
MTLEEMRAEVRLLIGETAQDGYLDTEIDRQINLGCQKVARECKLKTHVREDTVDARSLPSTDSRSEGRYALPSDFLQTVDREMRVLDADTWYPVTFVTAAEYNDLSWTQHWQRPIYAKIEFGSTETTSLAPGDIWFWPMPDAVYTYELKYYQKPSKLIADSEISELPEFAHLSACYHAAMLLTRKFRDRNLFQEMSALWSEEIDSVKREFNTLDAHMPKRTRNVYRVRSHR